MPLKAKPPTDTELQATLGAAMALWSDIVRAVEDSASPVDAAWRPSKAGFGRLCLLQHRKRTLLYLTPEREYVTVAIVLGERAFGLALASRLPAAIKKLLSDARPSAEGRGIRFSVRSPRDVATIRTLVAIKTAPR